MRTLIRAFGLGRAAFGFFPVHVHLGQGEVGELLIVGRGGALEVLKAADKLAVGAFQGFFGVDASEAGKIDQRKKSIAELVGGFFGVHPRRIAVAVLVAKFGQLFLHLLPHLLGLLPIEARAPGFFLNAHGLNQGR